MSQEPSPRTWQHRVDQELSALLAEAREASECTTDIDFASRIMMSSATFSKLVNGGRGWSFGDASRLACGLGLSPIQLFEDAELALCRKRAKEAEREDA